MKCDATDDKIIAMLQENGRTPNNEIAARLQVSEGTVRNRLRKLTDAGVLAIRGLRCADKVSEKQLVFLGAKVAMSKDLRRTARAVSELPYVKSVSIISGRYDLLIEVFAPPPEVISFIGDHLSSVGSIVSTESFMALESINKWL